MKEKVAIIAIVLGSIALLGQLLNLWFNDGDADFSFWAIVVSNALFIVAMAIITSVAWERKKLDSTASLSPP
jgi:uncharacterized membrane protein YqhA